MQIGDGKTLKTEVMETIQVKLCCFGSNKVKKFKNVLYVTGRDLNHL